MAAIFCTGPQTFGQARLIGIIRGAIDEHQF